MRGGRWAALCAGLPDPVGARRCGFAEADQEFFAQLIDETVIEATPTREPTGQRENIAQLPVITAQDNVELENLTLISVSADPEVVRALAVLKEKGITGAQVDQLQRIQPTKQQVRRAKRSLLDELVKNEVGNFLAKHSLNPVGRDLDRTRENFKTVKSAIDLQVKKMVPSGATARNDYASDDCDYLIAQLPHIVETVRRSCEMGSQRSLLRSVSAGTAGKRHTCRSNANHVLLKGDRILIVKIERDDFHYCVDCARKFITTAREKLTSLDSELQ